MLSLAVLHHSSSSSDLRLFVVPLLPKGREQHDRSGRGEPVGDAPSPPGHVETQLEQPFAQSPAVGHAQRRSKLSEQVDVCLGDLEAGNVE